ncbi:O-antigen ligase family protein [Sphingomonas sp. JC676]|uniref:O-antigen ligase family protein n=1 Tax=Sphingomonas sp. JC676 TaxID=2768065 RepID=UPI0016581DBA|nr:O-antigen ligase family protein [Sphingomonas sp. JC676]MBC9031384.1 O-antigen ligase family protein [Sphingomonas sp. JC676]
MLLAAFLAPYTTWRVMAGILFTASDALFCLGALFYFAGRRLSFRPLGDLTPIWFFGLAMLLIGLLIGSVANGDPARWIVVGAQYAFAFALVPILMIAVTRETAIRQAKAVLAGVVVMELFGISVYYYLAGSYEAAKRFGPEFITGEHRLGAFMADANWNAAVIAMTVPLVFYLQRTRRIGSVIGVVSLAILLVALLFTGSFTGFTATVVSVGLFFLICGNWRSLQLILALVAISSAIVVSGVALPSAFEKRVVGALQNQDLNQAGTYSGRLNLVKEAWTIIDETSVVGIGVDQYREVSRTRAPVHNIFLLLWAEGGLLAMFGWITMMLVPIALGIRMLARDRLAAGLGLAVFASFFMFSMAAPHMYSRSWGVPLFASMALILAPALRARRPGVPPLDTPPTRMARPGLG